MSASTAVNGSKLNPGRLALCLVGVALALSPMACAGTDKAARAEQEAALKREQDEVKRLQTELARQKRTADEVVKGPSKTSSDAIQKGELKDGKVQDGPKQRDFQIVMESKGKGEIVKRAFPLELGYGKQGSEFYELKAYHFFVTNTSSEIVRNVECSIADETAPQGIRVYKVAVIKPKETVSVEMNGVHFRGPVTVSCQGYDENIGLKAFTPDGRLDADVVPLVTPQGNVRGRRPD